ncbi:hypothetical protein [Tateyamaria sp.]|uniref:hypothetical protein n=1 Tax=Tateyamaria sp. TaxID=1929288 RepID=UPI00329ADD21
MKLGLTLMLTVGFSSTAVVGAAQDTDAAQCVHKGTNEMVTMLLCPEGLDREMLVMEGKLVCGDRKPCGAWIWVREEDLPLEAPDSHDKLTEQQITSSLGVWMNEHDQLVTIQAVQN